MSGAGTQKPSIGLDPANDGQLGGTFRWILRKAFQSLDGMLPATVIAVDAKRQFVTVQPSVMVLGTQGQTVSRAQIAKAPLFNAGAGGIVFSFPVKAGDPGWIFAADRDISNYIQKQAEAAPQTNRLHSFEDGVFVPDAMRQWALADTDAGNSVWQAYDGSYKVTLGPDQITILHPTKVLVTCPAVEMTGNLTVDGTITGKTDVLSGPSNISGKGHTHGGVQTGGGHTAGPDA